MDDDLFSLDEYSGPTAGMAGASFTTSRFPEAEDDSDEELDEAEGPVTAVAADLLTLLHREKTQLSSEHASKGLVPAFCEWLAHEGMAEQEVVDNVTRSLSTACLATVASLRETLSRFDTYGTSPERVLLEGQIRLLLGEAASWDLLHTTMADLRAAEGQEDAAALSRAAADKWVSDEQFFQMASRMDPISRRFRRVTGWLEHVCGVQSAASAAVRTERHWEATERSLARGVSVEKDAVTGGESMLVSRLDPDAPLRQDSSLHSIDQTIDNRLLRRVWELIRCGRIGQAVAECNACQQQWRSAMLMGMQPFHDPKVLNAADPSDGRGNTNAALLRRVCAEMAESKKLNPHERAMAGLFAGRLEPVLAVCGSYQDVLWALYKVNLLHRVLELRGKGETRVQTDEDMFETAAQAFPDQAQTPHARIQRAVILGQLNELVQMLSEYQSQADCSPHLHRFATTLLLMLSRVRVPVLNPTPVLLQTDAHRAIHTYMRAVVAGLHKPATVVALALHVPADERIAFVARFVAESVESRSIQEARELEAVSLIAEDERVRDAARKQDRRARYIQAIEAGGLDTGRVLLQVFVNLLPPDTAPVRAYHFGGASAEHEDESDGMGSHAALIEVLGWLTIRSDYWQESISVANAIARQLALRHRISHVRDVLRALPSLTLDRCRAACLGELRNGASFAFEVEYWRALCDGYDAFASWHTARGHSDPESISALYEGAEAALRRVIDFPDAPLFLPTRTDGLRQAQLFTIRENYIPQVFMMLHNLHYESGRFDLSLALADDVADNRKKLWSAFARTGTLEQFLGLMRESSMRLLALGHRCIVGFDVV